MPPDSPSATRSKPTRLTSLRMKPTRIRSTKCAFSVRGLEFGGAIVLLIANSLQFSQSDVEAFVPRQGCEDALAARIAWVDLGDDVAWLELEGLSEGFPRRSHDLASTPEAHAVLVSDSIGENDVSREKDREVAGNQVPGLLTAKLRLVDAPARRVGDDDHKIGPVGLEDRGAGQVPGVFADQDPDPPESGLEGAHAMARREIALLIEHAIGRQVDFAMRGQHRAAVNQYRGIVKPVLGTLLDEAEHDGG